MSKLYFGDAFIRIRNANIAVEAINTTSEGVITNRARGIRIFDKHGCALDIWPDASGCYPESTIVDAIEFCAP